MDPLKFGILGRNKKLFEKGENKNWMDRFKIRRINCFGFFYFVYDLCFDIKKDFDR